MQLILGGKSTRAQECRSIGTQENRSTGDPVIVINHCNIKIFVPFNGLKKLDYQKTYAIIYTIMKKNLTTPTILKGKRKHGFRARMATQDGQDVIKRRRQKGRKSLSK